MATTNTTDTQPTWPAPEYGDDRRTYTGEEIDAICQLTREWCQGHQKPGKGLRLTRAVRDWAKENGVLYEREGKGGYSPSARRQRLAYVTPEVYRAARTSIVHWIWQFNPANDLPVEALWRLVKPMLRDAGAAGTTTGYSVTSHRDWLNLNIWYADAPVLRSALAQEAKAGQRAEEEQYAVFVRLASYHYVIFQAAGSIWSIQVLPDEDHITRSR